MIGKPREGISDAKCCKDTELDQLVEFEIKEVIDKVALLELGGSRIEIRSR